MDEYILYQIAAQYTGVKLLLPHCHTTLFAMSPESHCFSVQVPPYSYVCQCLHCITGDTWHLTGSRLGGIKPKISLVGAQRLELSF